MNTVAAHQRQRIVDSMVAVTCEHGYTGVSVTAVCSHAKISRRTFHEVFDSLEDCFLAVLDNGMLRASTLISQAFEREESWQAGVREALAALLTFFDSEPVLAHVLLVEVTAAGAWARERRERHIAALTELIEAHWGAPRDGHMHPLVTAGVMASLLGVLHTHLVAGRDEPLIALLGPLMGLVTAPYLDQRFVAEEIEHGELMARELLAKYPAITRTPTRQDIEIPKLLDDPRAHRARACLAYLAGNTGASNRQIAHAAGIASHTQVSKLLTRFAQIGLIAKRDVQPGGPNSWSLTQYGQQVSLALGMGQQA